MHIVHYQNKGIKVCDKWLNGADGRRDFLLWCVDNGYKKGLEFDRIDNSLGYCPENCRFVSPKENRQNRTNCAPIDIQKLRKILNINGFSNYKIKGITL
jgi:hypothetical protein